MDQIWDINNRKATLDVSIKCQGVCLFRVYAEGLTTNSKYVDRTIEVDGFRTIELKFPVSPKKIRIVVEKDKRSEDKSDFIVKVSERELVTYNIHIDNTTDNFLNILVPFCQMSGFMHAPPGGRFISSKDKKFNIRFLPVIRDYRTGTVLNTPARIGHTTGIIEISKMKYDRYTVPMRIIIGLHEFCHKWKNPEINLPIEHESGADINALYIYLGLGFSKVDAIYVFANVFYKAQTDENIQRLRKIQKYIAAFENEEFAHKN